MTKWESTEVSYGLEQLLSELVQACSPKGSELYQGRELIVQMIAMRIYTKHPEGWDVVSSFKAAERFVKESVARAERLGKSE